MIAALARRNGPGIAYPRVAPTVTFGAVDVNRIQALAHAL